VIVGPYKVLEKLQNEQRVYDDRSASPAQGAAAATTAKPS